METSPDGLNFLERHEGVVLKAYRCPAGVLTIGAGLTKASGVIDPKPGMAITKKQASRLLAQSLRQNYEPAVARTMPGAKQHEFDGGVSFHFNTGKIGKASWVRAWIARDWADVERRILMWKKGGGRVLPGLVRRRKEEFRLLSTGDYGYQVGAPVAPRRDLATFALELDRDEIAEVREALRAIGYDPGAMPGQIDRPAVTKFQLDHDLTVDGIIGRATLSTLQRRVDAASKAKETASGTVGSGVGLGGATAISDLPVGVSAGVVVAVAVVGLLFALNFGWRYRDVVAAKIQRRFPKLATKLRSL